MGMCNNYVISYKLKFQTVTKSECIPQISECMIQTFFRKQKPGEILKC